MINKVVYFGNFSLENGFASVNRAIGISHLLSQAGYKTIIYLDDETKEFEDAVSLFDNQITLKHKSVGNKLLAYSSANQYLKIIKYEKPQIVILFDFPYFVAKKIIKYCRKYNIKVIGDFTEWFDSSGYKGLSKIMKTLDTELRMKRLPRIVDGSIAVSEYLLNHCKSISNKPVIKLYPLMDFVEFELKSLSINKQKDCLTIAYVGNPGGGKDLIKEIMEAIKNNSAQNIKLLLAGNVSVPEQLKNRIHCFGTVSHKKALEILLSSDYQIIYREPKKSNNAGFPTKFAESMIAGLPVITTCFSDIELILKKEDGYLFSFNKQTVSEILDIVVSDYNKCIKKNISQETKKLFLSKTYINSFNTFLDII